MDCSKTVDFIKVKGKICGDDHFCKCCPLSSFNNFKKLNCDRYLEQYPDEAIKKIQEWADVHMKTYMDDFFEKYPDAPREENGTPMAPWCIVYGTGRCTIKHGCCTDCWRKCING